MTEKHNIFFGIIFFWMAFLFAGLAWSDELDDKVKRAEIDLKGNPGDSLSYEKLGWLYLLRFEHKYDKQDISRALKVLKKYVTLDPENPTSHYLLGVAYFRKGQIEKAGEQFKRSLSLDPDYIQARMALGNYFLNKGNLRKAAHHYKMAAQLDSDHPALFANLAQLYLRAGKTEKALRLAERGLKKNANDTNLQFIKVQILRFTGKDKACVKIIEQILENSPEHAAAHYEAALTYFNLKDFVKSKNHAIRYNSIAPEMGSGYEMLALIYRQRGDFDKSKRALQIAENTYLNQLADGWEESYKLLAELYTEFDFNIPRALKYAKHYFQSRKTDEAHAALARAYFKSQNFHQALRHFKWAIKLNSRLAHHWYYLGLTYKALNETVKAEKAFRKSTTLGPRTHHDKAQREIFLLRGT